MQQRTVIPYVDLRAASPPALLRRYPDKARALVEASLHMAGPAAYQLGRALLPVGDRASRAWLERADNPYLAEIRAFADDLKMDGVYTLNVCFEWGCTAGAFQTADGIVLRRVLDWLFPRLGEYAVVARQQGPAGEFINVTWPGLAGVYQAMAPGRFAAAINQAPMRQHGGGALLDWLHNRIVTADRRALPAAHLLRQVFETAPDYAGARRLLCQTPIAVPAIFVLTGMAQTEGCVIERTETDFAVRDMESGRVTVTNHFQSRLNQTGRGWRARPIDSHGRAGAAAAMAANRRDAFGWFVPPIANRHSRLVMNACAGEGTMTAMGTEGEAPVTEVFTLSGRAADWIG